MSEEIDYEVQKMISEILDEAELASLYDDDELKDYSVYAKLASNLYKLKLEEKYYKEILKNVNECSTEEFDKLFQLLEEKQNTMPDVDVKNYGEYKEFNSKIKMLFDISPEKYIDLMKGGEDDDLITQASINRICPLTRDTIKNPLRNKICKHVYDKNGIQQIFDNNQSLRCPVAGCGNKKPISSDDLQFDILFARMLKYTSENDLRAMDS